MPGEKASANECKMPYLLITYLKNEHCFRKYNERLGDLTEKKSKKQTRNDFRWKYIFPENKTRLITRYWIVIGFVPQQISIIVPL